MVNIFAAVFVFTRKAMTTIVSLKSLKLCVVLLMVIVASPSTGYVCDDQSCISRGCSSPADCDGGRLIRNGGMCSCCDVCVKSLGENDTCSTKAEDGIPNKECGDGLSCDAIGKACVPRNSTCIRDRLAYDQLKNNGSLMVGSSRPACDYMGDYNATQCLTGTVCFCVNNDGERIFGSDHYTHVDSMTCLCSRDSSKFADHLSAVGGVLPSPLSLLGHCMPNGVYDSLQCVGENCFCYDDDDSRLVESVIPFDAKSILMCYDPLYHDEAYYRTCELQRMDVMAQMKNATSFGISLLDSLLPVCDLDGTFAPVQCRDNMCYCVHKNGSQVGSYQSPRYSDDALNMNCYCARDKTFAEDRSAVEEISCLGNGNYAAVQCRSNLCFCVNTFGVQVSGEVNSTEVERLHCDMS